LKHDLANVFGQFQISGAFREAEPWGLGHIHDTYAVTVEDGASRCRYILQRINDQVFRQPAHVQENVERVTQHLRRRLDASGAEDPERRALRPVPAHDGGAYYRDAEGNFWRVYHFIEGTRTVEVVKRPEEAFEAARAFGRFQRLLLDLPGPRLHETIPRFHDTDYRIELFSAAVARDRAGQAVTVPAEIDFARRHEGLAAVLPALAARGEILERVAHNDTKVNNVLLDAESGRALCVVDLDTVMPGWVHPDFGDLVRTATCRAREDETDLSRVALDFELFEAVARGYLDEAGSFLTPAEREHLVFSARLMSYTIGLRFLTDHLDGDVYFKVSCPCHNLARARVQFRLLESIEAQEGALRRCVERL